MITFIEYLTEARGQSPFREKAKELYGYLKAIKGANPRSWQDKVNFSNVDEQKAEFGVRQYIKLNKSRATNLVDAPIDAEFEKTCKTVAMVLGIKGAPKITKGRGYGLYFFERTVEYKGTTEDGYKIEYVAKMNSDSEKIENSISHDVVLIGKKTVSKTRGFTDFPNVVPGTIFVVSWGYDMTIVDYYQVVKRTGKSVYVRPIAANKDGGGWSGTTTAVKDSFTSATATRCLLKGNPKDKTNESVYINIDDHLGRVWDGKPKYYNTMD